MFSQFKKNKGKPDLSNLVLKVIPIILIIPVLYLFLFVGTMQALSAMGGALAVSLLGYLGVWAFIRAREKARESKKKNIPMGPLKPDPFRKNVNTFPTQALD